jgi:cephalosporin hydroxylase
LKKRLQPATLVLLGSLLGTLVMYALSRKAEPAVITPGDAEVIYRFQVLYHNQRIWALPHWLGIEVHQTPPDLLVTQEVITEIKPDFIVETGTKYGGSALFYASILDHVNPDGRIITVDIDPQVEKAGKLPLFRKYVRVIKGDSVGPSTLAQIAAAVKGKRTMVLLDSDHRAPHVLKELKAYSAFVSIGSYLIVEDTILDRSPFGIRPGPLAALQEFLKTNPPFMIDRSREKLLLTFYQDGWLKRI